MGTSTLPRAVSTLAIAAMLGLGLGACGGPGDSDYVDPDTGSTDAVTTPDAEVTDDAGGDFDGVTVSGTGSYAIGTDIPYGGFQLQGEPASQPDGCTWSIVDEDGVALAENQGSYAFITDVPEAVTFITDGCPDWEQFE